MAGAKTVQTGEAGFKAARQRLGDLSVSAPECSVLVVDDSQSLAQTYRQFLDGEPCRVHCVATGRDAMAAVADSVPDVVLLDLRLPDVSGMQVLDYIQKGKFATTVVVITAHGSVNTAVEAMRAGAFDFLVKPVSAGRLRDAICNAWECVRLTQSGQAAQKHRLQTQFCGFVGKSLKMQAVYRVIESAAPSKATVFLTGESGTGKELAAEAIHQLSPRAERPFVALNCAAIPAELIESEIFGHVRGAFTGAVSDRPGAVARAHGGTLFLDEVCEMDYALQTKLLRFIQTGAFQRVGGAETEHVDVRFVCATNQDPMQAVQDGRFREDLFYRLHVIPLVLPPLREREDDVVLIAHEMLRRITCEEGRRFVRFDEEAEAMLRSYGWPGNVRQLQNVLRNVVVLHDAEVVKADMLPRLVESAVPRAAENAPKIGENSSIRPLWQVERDTIENAIAACDGKVPKAAAMLGISASTIYRKLQSWQDKR